MQITQQSVRELVGFAGAALMGYGAWLHYPPLGYVVGGASLLVLAVIGTLRQRPSA